MKLSRHLTIICIILSTLCSQAQITVIDTLTVNELVNDFLLGDGVEASNITFNGMTGDDVYITVGLFQGMSDVVGFEEGIVMCTDGIFSTIIEGANDNVGDNFQDDPDLLQISGQNTLLNNAIIEFDFTVNSDSVKFNYVFASTEYPMFTCTTFNDAFGFFLSGPGLNGPFTNNAVNIALVPDSDTPVAINTVNSGMSSNPGEEPICEAANPNWIADSQYFVDNSDLPEGDVQFEGMTTTLQAEERIECGGVYHIKLAIGNAIDQQFDSGVFIEAGSFAAFGEVFASFAPVFGEDAGGGEVTQEGFDSIAVAGCTNPRITLDRPEGTQFDTLFFELQGTAVQSPDGSEGSGDYWVPGGFQTNFPDGQDQFSFEIETINPNITDTLEIQLVIFFTGCGGVLDSTVVEIPIAPPPDITISAEDKVLICSADTMPNLFISATAEGGLQPNTFEWFDEDFFQNSDPPLERIDSLAVLDSLLVPENSVTYWVRASDQCRFNYDSTLVVITNAFPEDLTFNLGSFTQPICPNEPVTIQVEPAITTGSPQYTYTWSSTRGTISGQGTSSIELQNPNSQAEFFAPSAEVMLTVRDSCLRMDTMSVQIFYPQYDSLVANFTPLVDNCPEVPVQLESIVQGGDGEYTYTWSIDGESTFTDGGPGPNAANSLIDAGGGFNTFALLAQDGCNLRGHDMLYAVQDEEGNFFRSGLDFSSQTIPYINLDRLPNIITPNGDGRNEVFIVEGINAFEDASVLIYDRWGKLIYENNSYDAGTPEATVSQGFSAEGFEDGTYFYIINIDSGECVTQGNLNVVGSNN